MSNELNRQPDLKKAPVLTEFLELTQSHYFVAEQPAFRLQFGLAFALALVYLTAAIPLLISQASCLPVAAQKHFPVTIVLVARRSLALSAPDVLVAVVVYAAPAPEKVVAHHSSDSRPSQLHCVACLQSLYLALPAPLFHFPLLSAVHPQAYFSHPHLSSFHLPPSSSHLHPFFSHLLSVSSALSLVEWQVGSRAQSHSPPFAHA